MAIYGSLFTEFKETASPDPFALQNSKLLKVQMQYGPVWARAGSMVAYQGDVRFEKAGSGGLDKLVKSALSGEGLKAMRCTGSGELFLADDSREVQILYLDNDAISINGANVLAFSASVDWDVQRISAPGAAMAGGMYNVVIRGTGYVAITTRGNPVALDVASAPTFADAHAVVLWTSGVRMDVRIDTGGIKTMLRGGSGESFQMAFGGQGHVFVQPSESVTQGAGQASGASGIGGLFG
ncbi:MAG TPA: AIM24 family protein [Propionibacteriaceae bacterium]|nr:AIM24 family protein [Propionibacteriaceae bacterium]